LACDKKKLSQIKENTQKLKITAISSKNVKMLRVILQKNRG